jgi:serine/threonine protein kinase
MGNGLVTTRGSSHQRHFSAPLSHAKKTGVSYLSVSHAKKATGSAYLCSDDIKSKYLFNSILAKNKAATIFNATCSRTNQAVVIKKIPLLQVINSSGEIDGVIAELQAMKSIQHQFIVKLLYATHEDTICYLAMAALPSGDLRYHLRVGETFPESAVAYIVACIGSALQFLHEHHIIHRDVKPENVVLDSCCRPVLIDLGIAFIGDGQKQYLPICHSTSGTLPYISPEILTPSHRHSVHADFWSLGVMAYELLFHRKPFEPHCPAVWVYFVANYYESMWDHLELSASSTSVSYTTLKTASSPRSLGSLIQYDTRFTRQLSHPAAHVMLNDDGSLPEILQLQIPSPEGSGDKKLSQEGIDLLRGLLDPRLEKRLGAVDQRSAFADHPWFIKHQCCDSLAEIPSPLLTESTAFFTYGAPLFEELDEEEPMAGVHLTTAMENKLKDYQYDMLTTCLNNNDVEGGMMIQSNTLSLTQPLPRENQLVDVE